MNNYTFHKFLYAFTVFVHNHDDKLSKLIPGFKKLHAVFFSGSQACFVLVEEDSSHRNFYINMTHVLDWADELGFGFSGQQYPLFRR